MKTYILKTTGTSIPFYLTESGKYTAHHSEAIKFNSIELAKSYITSGETFQILDENQKFAGWVNY